MRRLLISFSIILILIFISSSYAFGDQKLQNIPRITVKDIQRLMAIGAKVLFVYSGYEVDKIVCGSLYMPYTRLGFYYKSASFNKK